MKKRSTAEKRPRCNTPATSIHRDILSHIYGFLNNKEVHRACLVCWHWGNVLPRAISVKPSLDRVLRACGQPQARFSEYDESECEDLAEVRARHGDVGPFAFHEVKIRWSCLGPMARHSDLTSCSLVTELNFLSDLPNLRVLKLTNCTGITGRA